MDSRPTPISPPRLIRWGVAWAVFTLLVTLVTQIAKPREVDLSKLPPAAGRKVDFAADVKPIFAKHYISCHGPEKQKSDYRLDVKQSALNGGAIGGGIKPGKSDQSKLIHFVAGLDEEILMPPKGKKLTSDEISILRAWVDQGAAWPQEADAKPAEPELWSLKPLVKPAAPKLKDSAWARTPIDAFILARLQEKGLTPAPRADARTIIRRLHFNLIGLPPSPDQIAEFEARFTASPEIAIEELVEKLMASPRYGERWARHWMDVVHFAETHGHDQDRPRPHAWPYRDYLIRAFNEDKPYTRFIEEQIAGDVIYPDDPLAMAALGMLAAGPWDESSQMGIMDGVLDKKMAQVLDRDDMIATTLGSFNSLTIHCARCHNHKFDPISLEDYYSLQAVFSGVDRANRPYDPDPAVRARRAELQNEQTLLARKDVSLAEISTPANDAYLADWEKGLTTGAPVWEPLDPIASQSTGGATLTRQPDGSILSGGKRPEKETLIITARTSLKGVTAIRLQTLTDESLPHKGPGRQDNGNLHLSEFRVALVGPAADGASAPSIQPLALRAAVADFDQAGWGIARAIDGLPETAWGIYPKVGQPHEAIFELTAPANPEGSPVTLQISIDQLHGGGHLIGRVRLSATTAAKPLRVSAIPDAIAAILKTPSAQRNPEQVRTLALHALKLRNQERLSRLPAQRMVYAATSHFPVDGNFKPAIIPRPVSVLRRGDILQPIGPAAPGSLSCVPGLESRFKLAADQDEGARRAALARWVASPKNVLTWRSIVNRVWHYHFGRGIVDTPNDLGHMGGKPTHPELLDWLAASFRDDMGGSFKKLHKLIVTSAVYLQSTRHDEKSAALDGDNGLLWRMNRLRLDAEQTRDAVLAISGKLDLTMYGPSVKQFIEKPGIHVTPIVDYQGFDVDHPNQFRRSVYRFVFRTLPDPLMDSLDCPDLSQLTPRRSVSVTAQQALSMLNNRFMVRQCEHLAARVEKEIPGAEQAVEKRVQRLYALCLGRAPAAGELADVSAFVRAHGLAGAARLLINSNEFLFLN